MKASPFFCQLDGTGNTFVLALENEALTELMLEASVSKSELARRLCRLEETTVDGALFLKREGEVFVWDFFNSDGSSAEMCGNAARCAGRFVDEYSGRVKITPIEFLTPAGPVFVRRVQGSSYAVEMPTPRVLGEDVQVLLNDEIWRGLWIDTGVPHFVTREELGKNYSVEFCRGARRDAVFGPRGANITLTKNQTELSIEARTYERGVENFTKACGTGAVAAAWSILKGSDGTVEVLMPGGKLQAKFLAKKTTLIGPAEMTRSFRLEPGEIK